MSGCHVCTFSEAIHNSQIPPRLPPLNRSLSGAQTWLKAEQRAWHRLLINLKPLKTLSALLNASAVGPMQDFTSLLGSSECRLFIDESRSKTEP